VHIRRLFVYIRRLFVHIRRLFVHIRRLFVHIRASQTSACVVHQSNNHLDTVAARSVLEMGYSEEQVLQAIHKITPSYSGMYSMSIFDEHMIIM
jgi:4-aminobutyrate aminotransferase-like enzyme